MGLGLEGLPKGPKVVLFGGSYLELYKVIPKGTTLGPMGRGFGVGTWDLGLAACHVIPRSSAKATWRIVLEARNPQK